MCPVYKEPAREIPVIGEYDVIVAGAGAAGCAAALAAARKGVNTLLVERDGYLGGATVSQMITSILTTNGVDCQGIWHDWVRELKKRRGVTGLVHHPKPLAEYILAGTVPARSRTAIFITASWRHRLSVI